MREPTFIKCIDLITAVNGTLFRKSKHFDFSNIIDRIPKGCKFSVEEIY